MYTINRGTNNINKISEKTFGELGFREREHLQEWIAKNPDVFGEELLIIQKEFSGFNDTNERLDLLALDKQGNIVIIENKLDDLGKDVTWQILKYASYCSSLTKNQIREIYQNYLDRFEFNQNAEDNLKDFFDNEEFEELKINVGNTQRLVIVAANFRKEVTSTVLWLLNYKLRIQCFKVTPFEYNGQLLINFEQVIPIKGNEDYLISMADKAQSDISTQEESKSRHNLRKEFWKKLLAEINKKIDLFINISPSKDNWIAAGTGLSGVSYIFVISKKFARVELSISRPDKDENKFIFDYLISRKEEIEAEFGGSLIWERQDDKKSSRVKAELGNVNVFNDEDWNQMIEYMCNRMPLLEDAFRIPLRGAKLELNR